VVLLGPGAFLVRLLLSRRSLQTSSVVAMIADRTPCNRYRLRS